MDENTLPAGDPQDVVAPAVGIAPAGPGEPAEQPADEPAEQPAGEAPADVECAAEETRSAWDRLLDGVVPGTLDEPLTAATFSPCTPGCPDGCDGDHDTPDRPSRARHRGAGGPSRRGLWITLAVIGVATVAAVVAIVVLHGRSSHPAVAAKAAPALAVQHPADGTLTVGTTTITQIAGTCSGGQCRYPATSAAVVHSQPGSLPLHAAQSTQFPGVSAFNVAHPSDPAAATAFTASGGQLHFPTATPGTYRVTVIGNSGGTWQFTVVVDAPPTPSTSAAPAHPAPTTHRHR